MKKSITALAFGCLIVSAGLLHSSCNKDAVTGADSAAATTADGKIAVASADSTGSDSTYIIHECGNGQSRDSIAASALPDSVTSYLETNYAGYTFNKAYSVTDTTGNITGYVVIIYSDGKPVGIEFDSEGNFVTELEQRPFDGHGGHHH